MVNTFDDEVTERFYGRLLNGHLDAGVLQRRGGYMAGSWSGGTLAGDLVDDIAQRNVLIAAFKTAAGAASSASKSFARKGDAASSRLYAKEAQQLRNQLD